MAVFKELTPNDIKTARSFLNQIIDITQEDISGSSTRQTYSAFVTGGVGPGVTSSLFQTIHDQDFTLQTANEVFDMTVGLYFSGSTVQNIKTGEDSAGKLLFPSTSLMMREKINIYRQHAIVLLGDADSQFASPFGSATSTDLINEALFLDFKRLFFRDGVKRETFAMQFYQTSSNNGAGPATNTPNNLIRTSINGAKIFTDAGAAANQEVSFGGKVSNVVDSANTNRNVGLLFNDQGIVVLDLAKIISGTEHVTGVIDAMSNAAISGRTDTAAGLTLIGYQNSGNPNAKFIPDFLTSASMDNIIDYFASTRFSSGTLTAITFQNQTIINSTLVFARATADEFNYSSNQTFTDSDNRIVVIDEGQEDVQQTFTFVTSVGLYDANNNLLAVAKLSRPVEKNPEKDITFRVRLDF